MKDEIATRVATDKNIVLMAARVQNPHDAAYYGLVGLPLEYAKQVLDKNHNGSFSLHEASQDQIFRSMVGGNTSLILTQSLPDGGRSIFDNIYNLAPHLSYYNVISK